MSFRQFGGLQYTARHNAVSSNYNTSNNLQVTQNVGQPSSYINVLSDISANITGNTGSFQNLNYGTTINATYTTLPTLNINSIGYNYQAIVSNITLSTTARSNLEQFTFPALGIYLINMNVAIFSSVDETGTNNYAVISVSTTPSSNPTGQYSIFPMPFFQLTSTPTYMSSGNYSTVLNVSSTSQNYYIVFSTSTGASYTNLTNANLTYNYVKIA